MFDPVFNFHDVILIATAFQCLMFVLLITVAKRERHISDYFLVGVFAAQTAVSLDVLLNWGAVFQFITVAAPPDLFYLFGIAHWLEGPLLLWFTRAMLYKDFRLKQIDFIFLVPAIIYAVFIYITFFSADEASKALLIADREYIVAPTREHYVQAVREVFRVLFGVLCVWEVRQAGKQVKDQYSSIEKVDFNWITLLVVSFTAIRIWMLLIILMWLSFSPTLFTVVSYMGVAANYLTFTFISALMFFSLQRSSLFSGHLSKEASSPQSDESKIDPELTKKIEHHMSTEKPYLSHFLNLEQLASQLSMHPRALSAAIKKNFKTNFYEFVNSYRIDEAKKILGDPAERNKTMIEITGDCGFNSKATYNSFFKKLVGCTPTQYRKQKLGSL